MNTFDRKLPDLGALVERMLLSADGLDMWWAFSDALALSVGARKTGFYIHDDTYRNGGLRELRQIVRRAEHAPSGERVRYQLRSTSYFNESDLPYTAYADEYLDRTSLRIALRSFDSGKVTMDSSAQALTMLAIPVMEQIDENDHARPIAVCVLELPEADDEIDHARRSHLLSSVLPQLHPFAVYARARYLLPDVRRELDISTTSFNHLVDDLLKRVCVRLGFSYALISLINEAGDEVVAIRGRNVPKPWLEAARHPISSNDIVVDVLQKGTAEVFHANLDLDTRFDQAIYDQFNHQKLERVFVPLAKIGVLEAGWFEHESRKLSTVMLTALEHWATEAASLLKWKRESERQRDANNTLTKILTTGRELNKLPRLSQESDRIAHLNEFLGDLAELANSVLKSEIAIIYPIVPMPISRFEQVAGKDLSFLAPIVRGDPLKGNMVLQPPRGSNNIASRMLRDYAIKATKHRYVIDALNDTAITPKKSPKSKHGIDDYAGLYTFAEKQGIRSFAGAILEAYGDIIGVMFLNFKNAQSFSRQDRYLVEMFVQHAMDMLSSDWIAKLRERHQIHDRLHDSVRIRLAAVLTDVDTLDDELESSQGADHTQARMLVKRLARLLDLVYDELGEILRGGSGDVWSAIPMESTSRQSGLAFAIVDEVEHIMPFGEDRIKFDIPACLPSLSEPDQNSIVRIVSGLVSNAIRHSCAQQIKVQVKFDNDILKIDVIDDGIGLDTVSTTDSIEQLSASPSGRGGLARRARDLGASLNFSVPERGGTQCRLSLHIANDDERNTNEIAMDA